MVSSVWKEKSMTIDEESGARSLQPALPKTLEQLLRHHLFVGGIMDVFIESHTWIGRYRVLACHARYCSSEGLLLHPSTETSVYIHKGGAWITSPLTSFEFRSFYASGFTVQGKDGEIFFHATSLSTAVDRKVHVVLYPKDRPPTTDTLHVVGWQRTGQPIYNGSFPPYVVT